MIIDNRIAGTRITVWDVLYYLEHDWSHDEIAEILPISVDQVESTVAYIQSNASEVYRTYREIEQRHAQGNSPEIEAKLDRVRANRRAWLEERRQTTVTQ